MGIIKRPNGELRERIRATILTSRVLRDKLPESLYFFKPNQTFNTSPHNLILDDEETRKVVNAAKDMYVANLGSAVSGVIESIDIFSSCSSRDLPVLQSYVQSSIFEFKVGEKIRASLPTIKELKTYRNETILTENGVSHLEFKHILEGGCECPKIWPLQAIMGWIKFMYPDRSLGDSVIEFTVSLNGYFDLPVP